MCCAGTVLGTRDQAGRILTEVRHLFFTLLSSLRVQHKGMRIGHFHHSAAVLVLLATTNALVNAHHSFATVYDQSKPLHVQGTVDTLAWKNPHVTMTLVTRGTDETEIRWVFEMGAPQVLLNQFGWTPQSVQVGDKITIDGFRARDGSQQAVAMSITTRTGAQLRAVRPLR
jgi:hypothetical protein